MINPLIEVPSDIQALLDAHAPVAVGVSGGKDSVACALAVGKFLESIGHQGEKLLIHSDLGLVEWHDSAPSCHRVHKYLTDKYAPPPASHGAVRTGGPISNWDLVTVRRQAGGMMERWESRWQSSIRRYENLECVKLILPWSTPSMRFCTSELKSAPIASYIKKRFGERPVISVTGIRADESPNRAKMPPSKTNPRLYPGGLDWNPILRWSKEQVFAEIAESGVPLHEAYSVFGSSRVSCAFCIMSKADDLKAALRDERNIELYRRMCRLEGLSGFAFQQNKWLMDLEPQYLAVELQLQRWAKDTTELREKAEALIPKDLHFKLGWPERMPTPDEAKIIARVRTIITQRYQFKSRYLSTDTVLARYEELMKEKEVKDQKKTHG